MPGPGSPARRAGNPSALKTTDGGGTWTMFTNLPTFTSSDPNGTYALNGISCTSPRTCVAVGGLNESDGTATVISTASGGARWNRSMDPSLSGLQQLFSVSCLSVQVCVATTDNGLWVTSDDGGLVGTG